MQPSDAEVYIDDERWQGGDSGDRLTVQLAAGTHRVEIRKDGYRRFTTEVQTRGGQTVPLNVALTPERQ